MPQLFRKFMLSLNFSEWAIYISGLQYIASLLNIDCLMIGLRYGFHPRLTDVISQMSEVQASE